ncbi:hypothetical protein N431DRAFT_464187 [Stipitochalara longipes BDJ]|nr:hypothetical protein N431DRAFT_464187 [Stipitochalara longipes BDJ]
MASTVAEVHATAPVITFNNVESTRSAAPESSSQPQTKRTRIQLSCTHCRHAKLKCDREKPCSQCVKKGRASACTFVSPVTRKRPAISMQNRLKHLESLVKGVMTSRPPNGPQNPTEIHRTFFETPIYAKDGVSKSSGQVVLGANETTYVGATHWAAMLDDIEEVKSYFNEVEREGSPHEESVRPDLSVVFNSESLASKEDLLAALPERPIVDRLIYRYFNSNSPALHIIHKPTFQRNYKKFWADPHGSPISWLALIYSLMCLATFAALGAGEENADARGTPMEMIRNYRICCTRCLVLSNYAQPGPYTLETFLIYMEGEFVLSKDDQMNCYLIIGIAVRLAMRMGLHRDSDNVGGNITPYQGEIRRRIWHFLVQMDLMVSFHIGLPSMVQTIKSDTRVPLNLQDQDFDEDTTEMPPSRPETEITGMSYTLAKGRIARVFGKVVEQANLLTLPPYDEVMALDQELHQAFAAVPPLLRVTRMEFSVTDSPQLIIQRLSLAVLFHKSRCVLHRKYLMKERDNVAFSYSKKAGIDASMELLFIQAEVHEAVQPGGPLCKDLWFVSSLAMHDLLLAGMIVYLSLIQESEGIAPTVGVLQTPNIQQTEMIRALERSYIIWTETTSMSVDIKKACDVLGNMMKRVNSIYQRHSGAQLVSTGANDASGDNDRESISRLSLNEQIHSAALSTGVFDLFGGGQYQSLDDTTPSSGLAMQFDLDPISMPMDSLGAIIDTPTSFDWDIFDSHVRQPQANDQPWPDLSFYDFNFGEDYNYNI